MTPIRFHTLVSVGGGYANAGKQLTTAMTKNGATWDPNGAVALNFCMPPEYFFQDITIGYTPWETNKVPGHWVQNMQRVDDLWATSNWVAEVFKKESGREEIFVLPHGIENFWAPQRRELEHEPFTFLHIGADATRKGGEVMLQAWHKHFRNREDCKLIFKVNKFVAARIYDRDGSIVASPSSYNNVQILDKMLTQEQLLQLYYRCHCLVTTSRGEGWGLPPFEFMSSGGPVILPAATGMRDFSSYGIELTQLSMVESSNQKEHPGQWIDFELDEIIFHMESVMNHPQPYFDRAMVSAVKLHEEYDWNNIAQRALDRINYLANR